MNTVTVMIRAKLNGKYPYLPAVWSGNGRLKPNVTLVNGKEQKVEGRYYLRFTEGGKRRFELVGGDAGVAAATTHASRTIPGGLFVRSTPDIQMSLRLPFEETTHILGTSRPIHQSKLLSSGGELRITDAAQHTGNSGQSFPRIHLNPITGDIGPCV